MMSTQLPDVLSGSVSPTHDQELPGGIPASLFLIAGSGEYPGLVITEALKAGVGSIVMAAFEEETDPDLAKLAHKTFWMRVGQLGKLLQAAKASGCTHGIMAGQLAPSNLFNLRPDLRALTILAKLPARNAESLFGAVATELEKVGVSLLPATSFLENHLAPEGHLAGPGFKPRQLSDLQYGMQIAKEISRLDIGQTVVVKNGTVLAVEGFEGTNECIRRGGSLGRGGATMVKVSKPKQDLRFDVPVVGIVTLKTAKEAGIQRIGIEAGKTILLNRDAVYKEAQRLGITLFGISS